jgi:hypothetical protein
MYSIRDIYSIPVAIATTGILYIRPFDQLVYSIRLASYTTCLLYDLPLIRLAASPLALITPRKKARGKSFIRLARGRKNERR